MTARFMLVLACSIVGARTAGAQLPSAEVDMRVETPRAAPPRLEVTVVGAPMLPAQHLAIVDHGVAIAASQVTAYSDGNEPMALAIVYEGDEAWIGNDDVEADETARYPGALGRLEAGIDELRLAARVPPGSTAIAVSYGTGAQLRYDGPITALAGSALGSQKDYYRSIGSDLVQGVTLAMAKLEQSKAPVRALIVIGDGSDTDPEAAKPALVELKKRAAAAGIHVFGIIYKDALSGSPTVITSFAPAARVVNSLDGIVAELEDAVTRLTDRYYVTFVDDRLPWDGKLHDLVLRVGNQDMDPVSLDMPRWGHGTPWWRGFWGQLGAGVVLLGAIVAFTRLRAKA
ncbi:MAG TPA: hypothetical protein VLX92_05535 [Kofleriaceae bacterium]|nr:hypothetical protein [Kofleriaceae bacterium]